MFNKKLNNIYVTYTDEKQYFKILLILINYAKPIVDLKHFHYKPKGILLIRDGYIYNDTARYYTDMIAISSKDLFANY